MLDRSSPGYQLRITQVLFRAQVSLFDSLAYFTQLEITEDTKEKAAFRCLDLGRWPQIKGMSCDPRNELNILQKSMPKASTPSLRVIIFNLLVYSRSGPGEEHLIGPDKISGVIAAPGQKALQLGPLTYKEKIQAIMNLLHPLSMIKPLKFFKMVTTPSNCIPSFTIVPLSYLLNGGAKWQWCVDLGDTFEQVKDARMNAHSLGHIIANKFYGIHMNASILAPITSLQRNETTQVKDLKGTPSHTRLEVVEETSSKATLDEATKHIGATAAWNRTFKPAEHNHVVFDPTPTVTKILVSFRPSIEEEETTLITDHAALEWVRVYEKISRQLDAWGATSTVYPGLGILHQDDRKIRNRSIVNPLLRSIQIIPQDSPSNNNSIPRRQDAVRCDTALRAENKTSRPTTTPNTTYRAMCREDIIHGQVLDTSSRRQLAAEVKREDLSYTVKVVEEELTDSSRIKGLVNSESQGDAPLLPKSNPWTYPSGIKSSVMPSNEDGVRQSQLLITVDPITGMRRKFVKGYEMVKFLNSCRIEVQFVGETIIFASHLQGRCDELPVLHHIDARWKTQLRAPKSKVNSTLCWIYKLESMHNEPRRYSIARLQQLSFRSNMNKDLKAYPFTYNTSGYRKVKIDNQTRMSALLRPARLPSQLLPTAVPLDPMTGRPDYGGCYYSTMIIVVDLSELIIIISTHSTCDTTNERTNHLCKAHNANYQSLLDALWSKETCPTVPTSEDLDFLRCYEQCPLSVDGATRLQRRARSEQAHVSRLRPTQLRAPGPLIVEVRIVDDCYVGIWLNGMEGCEVRWYFKESTSCSAKREVNSLERGQHTALENLIDFIIGSNVLSSYWSINNYDSPVKSRGNLNLPNSTTSLNSIENSSDLSSKVTSKEDKTVSDSSHYEQSCPKGVYLDPDKKSCARLQC